MEEQGFLHHKEALAELAVHVHKITTVIVLLSFAGYGMAGWLWFKGQTLEALVVATVSYIFFRLFRRISLMVVRRIAVFNEDLHPAMEWLDAQIKDQGAKQVMSELDQRLFPRD
jgi:hypothetical protein